MNFKNVVKGRARVTKDQNENEDDFVLFGQNEEQVQEPNELEHEGHSRQPPEALRAENQQAGQEHQYFQLPQEIQEPR